LNEVSKREQPESNKVQDLIYITGGMSILTLQGEFAGIRYQTNKEPESNKTRRTERKKIMKDGYPQQKTIF
jgi:hypothetical protein